MIAYFQLSVLDIQAMNEAVPCLEFFSAYPALTEVALVLLASKLLLANTLFRVEVPIGHCTNVTFQRPLCQPTGRNWPKADWRLAGELV